MKEKNTVLIYLTYLFILIGGLFTSFFGYLYYQRSQWVYNSEGRFFSEDEGVVYHVQSKEVYGWMTCLGVIAILILLILATRMRRKARLMDASK